MHRSLENDPGELRHGVRILRVFKARAHAGKAEELAEKLHTTSRALVREQRAFLGLLGGGPAEAGARDVVFATLWRDFAGMRTMFGAQWRQPLLPPGYAELIESSSVEHFALEEEFWIAPTAPVRNE